MADSDKAVRYHPLFDCDVREAALWYDRRSPDLGTAFAELVRKRVDDVMRNPERFAKLPSGCRYVRVMRFPYIVLFDVRDDELFFLGVVHTGRSEEKWRERHKDR